MTRRLTTRQKTRRTLLFISFLLFPIIMNYFSPYVIIDGAAHGLINGSFIVFGLLFFSALFVGRLWCGWLCPGGGLEDACSLVNDKPARGGRLDWTKWFIWVPWLAVIGLSAVSAGGYSQVDVFYLTDSGVSVGQPHAYFIYYIVVGLFVTIALFAGRRGACHYICWMAPFMIVGRRIRNVFEWPALRLQADEQKCVDCGRCDRGCPMSLPVNQLVRAPSMEHDECILCGNCVDTCPQGVITFSFSAGD